MFEKTILALFTFLLGTVVVTILSSILTSLAGIKTYQLMWVVGVLTMAFLAFRIGWLIYRTITTPRS